jgi:putative molybdopterin biosynthesis protein
MTRDYYLEDIPMEEAQQRLLDALGDRLLPGEDVPLAEAFGRITAGPVWAKMSSPHFHAVAMDGYALYAGDTVSATETRPLTFTLNDNTFPVNTGNPLPAGTNAVVMIENVQFLDDTHISINAPVAPWQHVRMCGEDMVATELVIPANHKLRPVDLGAIAGCGHHAVNVRRRPLVVLIPTGSELVLTTQAPEPGQVIEYNSIVLGAQIAEVGGVSRTLPIVPDDKDRLRAALEDALGQNPDLILMLSGSSAGSRDFTAEIIQEKGELLVHGVAVRPGHPVIMGVVNSTPVIGVPGYPVSAALTGEIFIQPLIAGWLGQRAPMDMRPSVEASMTRKLLSPIGDDDFVRVTVAQVEDRLLATPLNRGAGVISSLVRADGLAHIPRFSEGVDANQTVRVALYRSEDTVRRALLIMGSHDPMIDLLAQYLQGTPVTSANVGSLGGLIALKRREAHLAGSHLLDEDTGEYNISALQRYLSDVPLRAVTFAYREQGMIVPPGNPLSIQSLDDLPRLRYVNRQKGSGTRLLLDYQLRQRDIASDQIHGYEREEYTHLGVAIAVSSGIADCGLGVRSAAIALGLDFIPVGWERYDFVIPDTSLPKAQPVLDALNNDVFRQMLGAQPGYDVRDTGQEAYRQ